LAFDVSQGGKNFSGGQKQRLSIARALVKKPEIYIFDDAFSALDFKTDIKLRRALKDYVKKATVIIVAQRVSTIIDADNILVLHEGSVVAQGKHKDLLRNCEIYREIVYSQLDPEEIDKTMELSQQVLSNEGVD
jgi:ATP-binding cassette subfamily B protein